MRAVIGNIVKLLAFVLMVLSFSFNPTAARAESVAPTCEVTGEFTGPPFRVEFTIQDSGSGLNTINVIEDINATISIPTFSSGSTNPLVVTATKIDQGGDFGVMVEAIDVAGNSSTCGFSQGVDIEPPNCEIIAENPGPPFSVEFSIQDSGSGLNTITVIEAINATISIPPFYPGVVSPPVIVTATRVDENQYFRVELGVTDMAGNESTCSYPPADVEPPTCELTGQNPGPPFSIRITIQDGWSGLNTINVVETINATVTIPTFSTGTRDPVVVEATQVAQGMDFSVLLEATDMAGNINTCRQPISISLESRPEFDAVGMDSNNLFNDYFKDMVVENGRDSQGNKINDFSDFLSEYFANTASPESPDPCFSKPAKEYLSALAGTWTEATYEWQITLQMKPVADIQLNLIGCVLRRSEVDVWKGAEQTGRYKLPWGLGHVFFIPSANPRITVLALPGAFATTGFPDEGFYLNTRVIPGLGVLPLVDGLFTSEAILEEGIVMALPETGYTNGNGQTMYELEKGDRIKVVIKVPFNNTADIRYGSDSVVLRYIGVVGTEYSTLQ